MLKFGNVGKGREAVGFASDACDTVNLAFQCVEVSFLQSTTKLPLATRTVDTSDMPSHIASLGTFILHRPATLCAVIRILGRKPLAAHGNLQKALVALVALKVVQII